MGLLDDILYSDASIFVDPNGFGEPIIYWPAPAEDISTQRTINATVIRNNPTHTLGTNRDVMPDAEVYVINDNVSGIASYEINTGGDRVYFAIRVNAVSGMAGGPEWHRMAMEPNDNNDVGILHLSV